MSTDRPSLRARLRYRFDNTLAAGTAAVILYLALITLALVLVAGLVLAVADVATGEDGNHGFVESVWLSLLRTMDPGTMGGDAGWPFRIVSLLVTLAGIFVVSALIGLISAGIDRKLDELRKGRSPVLEQGHTLILGWSPKLFSVIAELVLANENQSDACVVVLAPEDKVFMEDELRTRVTDRRTTRIVCRSGHPADPSDLELVRAHAAKAIIVLAPAGDDGDAHVTRTVLALMRDERVIGEVPVIAELTDAVHAAALEGATHGQVKTIVSSEVIGRITAQVCRQAGLSAVYQDLLDFDGDEIYFQHEPSLVGRTFADAAIAFETASVIGLHRADGTVELNPPPEAVVREGDVVIAIAEDDDTFVLAPPDRTTDPLPAVPDGDPPNPEHIVVLGWNGLGPLVLRELDEHVVPGSTTLVVTDPVLHPAADVAVDGLVHIEVKAEDGDTSNHDLIADALGRASTDHVIILCYQGDLSVAQSDARTLMTLLQLRKVLDDLPPDVRRPSVATELLDVRDVELARVTSPDDFVVSERLTSLMMAQLAENPQLSLVFRDLFDAAGTDLSLRPATSYVPVGQPVQFGSVVRSVLTRREVVIGYRSGDDIVLNPPKSAEVTFARDDTLIVLTAP